MIAPRIIGLQSKTKELRKLSQKHNDRLAQKINKFVHLPMLYN